MSKYIMAATHADPECLTDAGEDAMERYAYIVAHNAISEALYGLEDAARGVMPEGTEELLDYVVEEARDRLLMVLKKGDAEELR